MENSNKKLLYVLGRGLSGSTLITTLLDHSDDIHSVGELNFWVDGSSCSGCGVPIEDCNFWQAVRQNFETRSKHDWDEAMGLIRSQAVDLFSIISLYFNHSSPKIKLLSSMQKDFLASLADFTESKYVLDASKLPSRALFLMRHFPDSRFIHIVRRPEGYLSSYTHRIDKDGEVFFMGRDRQKSFWNFPVICIMALSWFVGNLLAELTKSLAPHRVIRIRYEDLMTQPAVEMARLEKFLDIDLSSTLEAIEMSQKIKIGHFIGGNARIRTDNNFVFEPSAGISRPIAWYYKIVARLFSWPLMLFYKYPLFRSTDMPVA